MIDGFSMAVGALWLLILVYVLVDDDDDRRGYR